MIDLLLKISFGILVVTILMVKETRRFGFLLFGFILILFNPYLLPFIIGSAITIALTASVVRGTRSLITTIAVGLVLVSVIGPTTAHFTRHTLNDHFDISWSEWFVMIVVISLVALSAILTAYITAMRWPFKKTSK